MILHPTTTIGLALISFPLWYAFDTITKDDRKAFWLTLAVIAGLQFLIYV